MFVAFEILEQKTLMFTMDSGSQKRAALIRDHLRGLTNEELDQLMVRVDQTYENQVQTDSMLLQG